LILFVCFSAFCLQFSLDNNFFMINSPNNKKYWYWSKKSLNIGFVQYQTERNPKFFDKIFDSKIKSMKISLFQHPLRIVASLLVSRLMINVFPLNPCGRG
jgi:hypothetical protein